MADRNESAEATGSCLCGAVRFSIRGPMRAVTYCHCAICRRAASNVVAYTACAPESIEIEGLRKLKWYRSTPAVRRGFCKECGSQLFWESAHEPTLSVSAGSLDQPTGLRPGAHIHLEYVPDYERTAPETVSPGRP